MLEPKIGMDLELFLFHVFSRDYWNAQQLLAGISMYTHSSMRFGISDLPSVPLASCVLVSALMIEASFKTTNGEVSTVLRMDL